MNGVGSQTPVHDAPSMRRLAVWGSFTAFVALAVGSLALFAALSLIEGVGLEALTDPVGWLAALDTATASDILFNAADVVAGVLAIAITVSAIVVELAANRYNHRITWLFVREPINVAVMSLFMVTTILCIWVATTREPDVVARVPHAAFAVTMTLVSCSLLVLLPYFAFVFAFLSPLSVIQKIKSQAYRWIELARVKPAALAQRRVAESIDELQDVARGATEQSDRGIAMACIDALADLIEHYLAMRRDLPAAWFEVGGSVSTDPDFVSLAPTALQEIEDDRLWLEVKVFRQYLSLLAQSLPHARDVANLVAIDTGRIALLAAGRDPALLALCIRCFNSYLRTTINAVDPRSSYYLLNQYRLVAEDLVRRGASEPVSEIARHFRFYGQLAHKLGQSFLLEVAAHDLVTLIEAALGGDDALTDDLIGVLLELDQEIRSETHEESLLGVRRAQIQLATLLLMRGDEVRAHRISEDLRSEKRERLERIRTHLELEVRPQYWEFTDRGVNFGYLPPERRPALATLFRWLAG